MTFDWLLIHQAIGTPRPAFLGTPPALAPLRDIDVILRLSCLLLR